MNTMLLVVDMQNGFLNRHSEHVIGGVKTMLAHADSNAWKVVFTKFVNVAEGPYTRFIKWSRMMESPETDLAAGLARESDLLVVKNQYSSFVPEFRELIQSNGVGRLFICGIATDGCVLASAVDAFQSGIEPVVVHDACASHAGQEVHEMGLALLRRFIGRGQVRSIEECSMP